jgi:hypothetical protein
MTNDDDCPNDDDDVGPAGGGGQRLEDDWMGFLLTDVDCTCNTND